MANTILRIKRSTATATPPDGSLANGEFAYSYNSKTLFMGNTAGTGVIEVGGERIVELIQYTSIIANLAFDTANSAAGNSGSALAIAAYGQANAAYVAANNAQNTAVAAFNAANNASDTWVRGHANGAFDQANTALGVAQAAFANSNTQTSRITSAWATANAALPAAGGTITGDLIVSGNVTFSGQTTYANTTNLEIGDSIIVLNAEQPQGTAPTENAGIEVNRGSMPNVSIYWNETNDSWVMTQNAATQNIASSNDIASVFASSNAVSSIAVGAFAQANAAQTVAILAYGQANQALLVAQGAFGNANAQTIRVTSAWDQANAAQTVAILAYGAANQASLVAIAAYANSNAQTSRVTSAWDKANLAAGFANDASTIASGTLLVNYGGTGLNSVATNGLLYGQGTSAMGVVNAGVEGKVLQANSTGVPFFGDVDGGLF